MIRLSIPPIAESSVAVSTSEPAAVDMVLPRTTNGRTQAPSMFEESFRTLRTNLLLRHDSDTRAFVITSATPGEGKSTIAANLACSLAATHKRILLIDADLRRPAAHRFFELSNGRGLCDVLRGSAPAEQVWQKCAHGPTVLTSGPTPESNSST